MKNKMQTLWKERKEDIFWFTLGLGIIVIFRNLLDKSISGITGILIIYLVVKSKCVIVKRILSFVFVALFIRFLFNNWKDILAWLFTVAEICGIFLLNALPDDFPSKFPDDHSLTEDDIKQEQEGII